MRTSRSSQSGVMGPGPGRLAVVFASGAPPALARTSPWQTGPYAAPIRASIDHRNQRPHDRATDIDATPLRTGHGSHSMPAPHRVVASEGIYTLSRLLIRLKSWANRSMVVSSTSSRSLVAARIR